MLEDSKCNQKKKNSNSIKVVLKKYLSEEANKRERERERERLQSLADHLQMLGMVETERKRRKRKQERKAQQRETDIRSDKIGSEEREPWSSGYR